MREALKHDSMSKAPSHPGEKGLFVFLAV